MISQVFLVHQNSRYVGGITGFKTEPKPAILQVSKVWIAGSSVTEISFRVHRFVKFCYYAKKLSLYLLFVSFFDIHRSLGNLFQRKSWSSSNRGCFSLFPSTSFFNFRSAPYIQDCVVPPSALSQTRIWSFVPIQVAVESAILEREHPYSRHKIFQIGSLP